MVHALVLPLSLVLRKVYTLHQGETLRGDTVFYRDSFKVVVPKVTSYSLAATISRGAARSGGGKRGCRDEKI
jgi:hypothetical protein